MAARPVIDEGDEGKDAIEHIEQIRKKLREAQKVDMAFLLDATGSMGPLIKAVKEKIVEIAKGVKEAFPEDGELRFACAFYRDYDADEVLDPNTGKPLYPRSGICCHFTGDVGVFQEHLKGLEAWGGDDHPEDVFSGLVRLLELDWKAPATRLVYHIADAPCHGRRFHDPQYAEKFEDRAFKREHFKSIGATSEDDPEGRKIEDILTRFAVTAKISSYTFLHIRNEKGQQPTTAKMLEEFRKANDGNPSSIKIDEHTAEMPNGRGPKFVEAMKAVAELLSRIVGNDAKSNVNSIMNDLVNKPSVVNNQAIYAEIRVDDRIPADWAMLTMRQVYLHRSERYGTVGEMLTQLEQGSPLGLRVNTKAPILVRIAEHPFTPACATRWPFYAKIQAVRSSSDPTALYVIKKFKSVDNSYLKDYTNPHKNPYLEVMETYAIASQFAAQFNVEIKGNPALGRAKRLDVDRGLATCKVADSAEECFTVETLYSNAQWIKADEHPDYYETLQAFSHWTHVHSEEFLLVIVHTLILKGGTGDEAPTALLCDPTIHSKKYRYRFKRTNKGELGIQHFYRNHKCNDFCKVLGLEASA